jgi:hypothetical protein
MDTQYIDQARALDMRDRQEDAEAPDTTDVDSFADWLYAGTQNDPVQCNYVPYCEKQLRNMAVALTHSELVQWLMYPSITVAGVAALELQDRFEKQGGKL